MQVSPEPEPSSPTDSGIPDSGIPDSGIPDSGIPDSGIPDSGIPDSGIPDSGIQDSGIPDSGIQDSGIPDSGIPDSGIPDSGIQLDAGYDGGVLDSGEPLIIEQFTVNGGETAQVPASTTITLAWLVRGANNCTIESNGPTVGEVEPAAGTREVVVTSTTRFTLTCENSVTFVEEELDVLVLPAPSINVFEASPEVVNPGQSTTLTWSVVDATSCTLNGDSRGVTGSEVITLNETTLFELACVGDGGTAEVSITVSVNGTASVTSFLANNDTLAVVDPGGMVALSWATEDATTCTLNGATVLPNGTQQVAPTNSQEFELVCVGGGTTAVSAVRVIVRRPFWGGVARSLATTSEGHVAALSCHNCYTVSTSPETSLQATLTKIHNAQFDGADLIELDVKEEGGILRVDHDDAGSVNGAAFADILEDNALQFNNQILYIEMKELNPTYLFVATLLDTLVARGYASSGRPVVLRAFQSSRQGLVIARDLLDAEPEYPSIRDFVLLSELYGQGQSNTLEETQGLMRQAAIDGFDGVEFFLQIPNLATNLSFARSLGLGSNVYTIPSGFGEVFISVVKNLTDTITTDYSLVKSRATIQETTGLLYLNASEVDPSASSVNWRNANQQIDGRAVGLPGTPSLQTGAAGDAFFGTYLSFNRQMSEVLKFGTENAAAGEGYLVTASVVFDDLNLADGETRVIVGKADSGGFTLELNNPTGSEGNLLLFGVYVGGTYYYARYPATGLVSGRAYLLAAAYDGDGGVRLWVDNKSTGVQNASATGGVGGNNSPICVGADPSGPTNTTAHWTGGIQHVQVQSWGAH